MQLLKSTFLILATMAMALGAQPPTPSIVGPTGFTAAATEISFELPGAMRSFLNRFEGTWDGELEMTDASGAIDQRIPASCSFKWGTIDGLEVLHCQTVYRDERIPSSIAFIYFDGEGLVFQVVGASGSRSFTGTLDPDGNGIEWIPEDVQNDSVDKHSHRFLQGDDGAEEIEFSAVEAIRRSGLDIEIHMTGRFAREAEAGAESESETEN